MNPSEPQDEFFERLYDQWRQLKPGPRAEIRRATSPDDLLDLPAFYRLVGACGWQTGLPPWEQARWTRLVYLMEYLKPGGQDSLGTALGKSGRINEKRIYQIVRSDSPRDIEQLRRVLVQAEPEVNWPKVARQLWYWNRRQKRTLLEDFVIHQPREQEAFDHDT